MKHVSLHFSKILFFILCYWNICLPEGSAAGTLVKIPDGYVKIEDLNVGDTVVCYDSHKNYTSSIITDISKKLIPCYISITIADENIYLSPDQSLYDENNDTWIIASSLQTNNSLSSQLIKITSIKKPIEVYLLSIAHHHNFFISTKELCVHNFFPPVVLGLSIAFGSGGLEIAGLSCGFAGLGAFLGYKWRQKHKQSQFIIEPMQFPITQESHETHNLNDAQAPGMPTEKDEFYPPKKWDGKKVKNPRGPGFGWPDRDGNIWVPSGPKGHGGPHWDVQISGGKKYRNILPGGKER